MYQVIICTISSGRIQRKTFDSWDAAWKCADSWSAKNVRNRTYTVTVEHVKAAPAAALTTKQTGRTAGI